MLATHHALLATLIVAVVVTANPAVEHAFRRYMNSNECLRACMRPVQESERDIAIFKQSNFADYLLNIDQVCATIDTARACIDACNINSNPFALNSVTLLCSAEKRREIALLSDCFNKESATVNAQCESQCGSKYETINERVRLATATAKPDDARAHAELMKMSGDTCSSLKCTSRCVAEAYNTRCAPLPSSERVGDVLRRLIESVLAAHRDDLEAHGLVETMMQTSAPECNYHYAPQALFSAEHDAQTLEAARRMLEAHTPSATTAAPLSAAEGDAMLASLKNAAARRINLTLGQLQMRLLEKQMDVLDKQARNLDRDYDKTNIELARLLHKPRGPFFASAPAFF